MWGSPLLQEAHSALLLCFSSSASAQTGEHLPASLQAPGLPARCLALAGDLATTRKQLSARAPWPGWWPHVGVSAQSGGSCRRCLGGPRGSPPPPMHPAPPQRHPEVRVPVCVTCAPRPEMKQGKEGEHSKAISPLAAQPAGGLRTAGPWCSRSRSVCTRNGFAFQNAHSGWCQSRALTGRHGCDWEENFCVWLNLFKHLF